MTHRKIPPSSMLHKYCRSVEPLDPDIVSPTPDTLAQLHQESTRSLLFLSVSHEMLVLQTPSQTPHLRHQHRRVLCVHPMGYPISRTFRAILDRPHLGFATAS